MVDQGRPSLGWRQLEGQGRGPLLLLYCYWVLFPEVKRGRCNHKRHRSVRQGAFAASGLKEACARALGRVQVWCWQSPPGLAQGNPSDSEPGLHPFQADFPYFI